MNIPVLIVAIITVVAFLAHTFVGTRESLSVAPEKLGDKNTLDNFDVLEKNWIQSLCAFQMITVDLLLLTVLLFVIALTDYIPFERPLTMGLSVLYFLWGIAWFIQLSILTKDRKNYLLLAQWLLWFVSAGLLYWGARLM